MSDEILGFGFQATRTPYRVSRISYPAARMGSHGFGFRNSEGI